jgi:RNA polymerase-associated protein RTF1
MDESDSDREDEKEESSPVNPFPLEGRYMNEEDRNYIESLPQLRKEQILGDRAEEIQRYRFKEELARKAKQRELEEAQAEKRKRKASTLEPEDSYRKSSRQKTKTSDKLEAYKREREQRGRQRQGLDDRRRNRRHSDSPEKAGSEIDAEGESEVDWEDQRRKAAVPEPPATLRHFESVRMSRAFFHKVCFFPGFEEAMVGTFARIGTGQDAQRRTLYKMAQIKGMFDHHNEMYTVANKANRVLDR